MRELQCIARENLILCNRCLTRVIRGNLWRGHSDIGCENPWRRFNLANFKSKVAKFKTVLLYIVQAGKSISWKVQLGEYNEKG